MRHKYLWACCLAVAALVWAVAVIPFHSRSLVQANQPWKTSGSFKTGSPWPNAAFDPQMSPLEKNESTFFASWSAGPADFGELESPAFSSPRILECSLSGYPANPGLALYLERLGDRARFPLTLPGNNSPGDI